MFEQSLYEQPTPETSAVETTEEGGLFSTYEIKNWSLGPRIYKIIGMSVLANVLALAVFSTTSLLTMKGCDSPLVGSVCSVLDTVYVGTLLFGTDREMVDQDYEKTELADAEIIFTGMTPESEKVSYPEGYFQIANPIEYQAKLDAMNAMNQVNMGSDPTQPGYVAPGIPVGIPTNPSRSGGSLFDTKPKIPKRNDNLVAGIPSSIDEVNDATPNKGPRKPPFGKPTNGGIKPNPTTDGSLKPEPDPNANAGNNDPADGPVADKNGVILNKRPLKVFAEKNKPKIANLTPESVFKVTVSADLGPGKDSKGKEIDTIVLKNVVPVEQVAGNKKDMDMVKLTLDGLLALGDSGWMGYLHRVGVKKVLITVDQNATDFKVTIKADQPDENTAKAMAKGLGTYLSVGQAGAAGDDKLFLDAASLSAEGKAFFVNIKLDTPIVVDLIKRKMAEPDKKDGRAGQNAKLTQNIG